MREQALEQLVEVGLRSRPELHERQACGGVRGEHVHQAVALAAAEALDLRGHVSDQAVAGLDQHLAPLHRYPIVFLPSSDSRMMSAWPACWAVSATRWSNTRRADHDVPGGNHGASGSGWAALSDGSATTSSSVRRAASA